MGRKKKKRISKGEHEVIRILEKKNIQYEKEKTFQSCLSPKGYKLRFDFYLPEFNILIEYNGHHHYQPINKYRKAKITHEKTVINDRIKDDFAKEHNIKLIKIPYWDFDQTEMYVDTIYEKE